MTLPCFDSITQVPAALRGQAVLAASHGGAYVAKLALQLRLGGLIVSDAGVGREQAGIAGLEILEARGVAAAAVSVHFARIGDGRDCLIRGRISFANEHARALGVQPDMLAAGALALLSEHAREPTGDLGTCAENRSSEMVAGRPVVIVDSNALVGPQDQGAILVTGSHGGLLGSRAESAIKWPVAAAVYNDADVGIERAGIGRLAALDAKGIAAATVSAWSARIGDGRSTLEDGYVTHVNACAMRAGGDVGISCRELVARFGAALAADQQREHRQ
jgi:hypothetical protein